MLQGCGGWGLCDFAVQQIQIQPMPAAPVVCQATGEEEEMCTQLSAEWYWLQGLCDHLVAGLGLGAFCPFWH